MMPFEGGALDLSHSIVQNKPLFVNDVRDITTNSAFPPRSDSCFILAQVRKDIPKMLALVINKVRRLAETRYCHTDSCTTAT